MSARTATCSATSGHRAARPGRDLLAWMVEEGRRRTWRRSRTTSFCQNLNMRFLTSMMQDPDSLGKKFAMFPHINGVLRRFIGSKTKWEMYEQAQRRRLALRHRQHAGRHREEPAAPVTEKWLTRVEHPELEATPRVPRRALPISRDAVGDTAGGHRAPGEHNGGNSARRRGGRPNRREIEQ